MTAGVRSLAGVPLSAHTTLGVGGPAAHWCEARNMAEVRAALAFAAERALDVVVLGGGSNMLVADRGLDALVLRVRIDGIEAREADGEARVSVGAGTTWDELVAWTVERGYAGIECLSGIPGEVGAAPMQNIGAYGQEVAGVIERVQLIDRNDGSAIELDAAACGFGYRDSIFKHEAADRYVVVRVDFRFAKGPGAVAYAELERALATTSATVAEVRAKVIALRRAKSMVLDPHDENRRSAGSFFVNPTVTAAEADEVAARAATVAPGQAMPRFDHDGTAKLSAAWLIERGGLPRGTRRGEVGLSSRHCLAIVNHGAATAADIVAFAGEVRARVREVFGVSLTPEPRCYGFRDRELAALVE